MMILVYKTIIKMALTLPATNRKKEKCQQSETVLELLSANCT